MITGLTVGIIRILDSNSTTTGTGFVVTDDGLIATCAHVVANAGAEPGDTVRLVFQLNGEERQARVESEWWRGPDAEDVATLRLEGPMPEGVAAVVLGEAEGCDGHRFRTFGYPAIGDVEGLWATGEIKGLVRDAGGRQMLQLASPELAQGVSGAPVLDETQQRVVGMVTAVYHPTSTTKHRDTGFATPTETLRQACPELAQPSGPTVNPFFISGRINDPDLFFGRNQIICEIRSELRKRCNVSLVGESQIGKSSLLYYLYATRDDWLPEVTIEYVDLQGVLDEADFCETVLDRLGKSGDTLRDLKRALQTSEVILLLDEVERIAEPDFNPRLHDLLRSLAQERHFAMCLATQRPLVEVFPARTPGGVSPFHNIFTIKTLGPFTETEARAFLATHLASTGMTFTEREIERLLTDSQCHPAKLQQMAKVLFKEKVE